MLPIIAPIVVAGGAAAAGYGVNSATSPSLNSGSPRQSSAAELRGEVRAPASTDEVSISGGAVCFSPVIDQAANARTGFIRDRNGTFNRLGGAASCFSMYRLTMDLGNRANEFTELLLEVVPREQLREIYGQYIDTGARQYDTSSLSPLARNICTAMVNAWVQFGTALRVLSRAYRMAGIPVAARPSEYASRNQSLETLVYTGYWNPLARHYSPSSQPGAVVSNIRYSYQWASVGIRIMGTFMGAFPDIVNMNQDDATAMGADFQSEADILQGEMGAVTAAAVGYAVMWVAIGIGIAIGIVKTIETVGWMLGRQADMEEALVDHYRECLDQCLDAELSQDERQSWCQTCAELATSAESFKSPFSDVSRVALTFGTVALVAYGGYKGYRYIEKTDSGKIAKFKQLIGARTK